MIPKLNSVSVYPNPSRNDDLKFIISEPQSRKHSEKRLEINIYNIKGQLVKNSTNFKVIGNERVFVWDRKNNENKYVSSGVYTYKIKSDDGVYTGKILITK